MEDKNTFNENIHDYLFNRLDSNQKDDFEDLLQSDEELKGDMEAYLGLQALAENLLEEDLLNDIMLDINERRSNQTQEITYTLEELLDMFAPSPAYEMEVVRSADAAHPDAKQNIGLLKPENGEDCSEKLLIQLVQTYDFELNLVIKNNREKDVYRSILPPQTSQLSLNIQDMQLLPGRYYLKLSPKNRRLARQYQTALKVFFVQKDLKPDF